MTDKQEKNNDEFEKFIERIPDKPISDMRSIQEGFSLDTKIHLDNTDKEK